MINMGKVNRSKNNIRKMGGNVMIKTNMTANKIKLMLKKMFWNKWLLELKRVMNLMEVLFLMLKDRVHSRMIS